MPTVPPRRASQRRFGYRTILGFAALILMIIGIWRVNYELDHLWDASWDEVARVTSPSGMLDALLFETNGGATTAFGYEVHVVPRAANASKVEPPAWLYGAVRNVCAGGAKLKWIDDTLVAVEYATAKRVRNMHSADITGFRPVRIELREGIEDTKAPCGGMLHNLQQHVTSGGK